MLQCVAVHAPNRRRSISANEPTDNNIIIGVFAKRDLDNTASNGVSTPSLRSSVPGSLSLHVSIYACESEGVHLCQSRVSAYL